MHGTLSKSRLGSGSLFILPLVAASLSPAALEAGAAQRQAQRVSDTVVVNVTIPARPALATLRVEVTIGQENGPPEYTLGGIASFVMLPDGSILIGEDQGTVAHVRWYDSTGKFVRTLGRKGDGPGEFRSVRDITVHPNGRILVLDDSRRAIVVFSAQGNYLENWPLSGMSGFGSFQFFAAPDGITYVSTRSVPIGQTPPEGMSQTMYNYVRLDASGRILDTITHPPVHAMPSRRITGRDGGGRNTSVSIPFAPEFASFMSRAGYFVTGRSDRAAVDLLLPARQGQSTRPWRPGDPITSLRWNAPPVPFRTAELQILRNRLDTRLRSGSGWSATNLDIPRNRPHWLYGITGYDGRIFLIGFDPDHTYTEAEFSDFDDEAVHVWDAFEPNGRYLGRVRTEPGTIIIPQRGDRALMFNFLADVPRVQRVRIVWPPG